MNSIQDYYRLRSIAVKWIYDNRNNPSCWNWPVISTINTDQDSPRLSEQIAIQIWTDLIENKMMVPSPQQVNNQIVYHLNLGNTSNWHKMIYPPNKIMRFVSNVYKLLILNPLFIAIISAFIGFYLKDILIGNKLNELNTTITSVNNGMYHNQIDLLNFKNQHQFDQIIFNKKIDSLTIEIQKMQKTSNQVNSKISIPSH